MSEARRISVGELRATISDAQELAKGTQIFDAGGVVHLSRYQNKLFCEAKGSGAAPYKVSIVFGEAASVKGRCSCMAARSRPFCKHAAALLVAWARAPESFVVAETAPAEVAGGAMAAKKKSVRTGKTSAADLMKNGVEQANTLVRELAVAGVASLPPDRVTQIRALGEALREQRLRRLSARTLNLALVLEAGARSGLRGGGLSSQGYTDLVADMLLTVRKLEKHLAGEALDDRYVEELIGKTWRKDDRKPVENLSLVEYAFFARTTSDGFVIRESRFLDLASGTHYSEKQILPGFLAKRTEPKKSWAGRLLCGVRGSIYPGFAPFRLDIEEVPAARALDGDALAELCAQALPAVGAALAAFQEQRKDVFAPDRMPAAVRVETLLLSGTRAQAVDGEGAALFLPEDAGLQERLGALLREGELQALLGDIDVDGALPTLYPHAAVVKSPLGLELRSLAAPTAAEPARGGRFARFTHAAAAEAAGAAADAAWLESARAAGASAAAISLAEIREELAQCFVTGLAAFIPRTTDPLAARLRDLGLEKQAVLLDATAQRPEVVARLDDFVKLYQVLEIALVRLLGTARVDRQSLERVPTYESVFVPRPDRALAPAEVTRLRAQGQLNRYQAAVHYARYYEQLPPEELSKSIFPIWADGSASPFVARTFGRAGGAAIEAARKALGMQAGRVARLTAIRVLQAAGGHEAETLLRQLSRDESDEVLRVLAADALDALAIRRGEVAAPRERRAKMAEQLAPRIERLQSAPQKDDRLAAITALVRLGDQAALPALRVAFAGDASGEVRERAALALGQLIDTELVETFVRMLAERAANDESAKVAAYALGHLGDVRGLDALLAAYADGWKPGIVGDALRAMGVVALPPLVDLIEGRPDIVARKVALDVVARVPADELSAHLSDRLAAGRAQPAFADHAKLYLKLAGVHDDARRAVAHKILALVPEPASGDERSLRKAAERALRS